MQGARKFDHTFLSPTASNNRLHLTPGSVVRLWHASRILLPGAGEAWRWVARAAGGWRGLSLRAVGWVGGGRGTGRGPGVRGGPSCAGRLGHGGAVCRRDGLAPPNFALEPTAPRGACTPYASS
jgi:hypothetical protein